MLPPSTLPKRIDVSSPSVEEISLFVANTDISRAFYEALGFWGGSIPVSVDAFGSAYFKPCAGLTIRPATQMDGVTSPVHMRLVVSDLRQILARLRKEWLVQPVNLTGLPLDTHEAIVKDPDGNFINLKSNDAGPK